MSYLRVRAIRSFADAAPSECKHIVAGIVRLPHEGHSPVRDTVCLELVRFGNTRAIRCAAISSPTVFILAIWPVPVSDIPLRSPPAEYAGAFTQSPQAEETAIQNCVQSFAATRPARSTFYDNRTVPHSPDRPWDDGRALVLIIEADQTTRELYRDWFFAQGFQVMCAVGVTGLSMALREERPSLIISELRARDLTLAAVIARLQSAPSTRLIPILVLTSVTDSTEIRAAESSTGVVAVLPKLADFRELRRFVEVLVPSVTPQPRR